jgi:pilus assembly protein Flp/PilA
MLSIARFFTAVASPRFDRTGFIQSTKSEGIKMNIIKSLKNVAVDFAREEDGAQVVEYALVIALVSIGLAVALSAAFGSGAGSAFASLVTRVKSCFAAGATTC